MIKILQVLDCLGTGGIQSFIMNIYRNIDKRQYKFDFLVTRRLENSLEKEAEELGANIYVVPPRSQGIRKNKQALKRFFLNIQTMMLFTNTKVVFHTWSR